MDCQDFHFLRYHPDILLNRRLPCSRWLGIIPLDDVALVVNGALNFQMQVLKIRFLMIY